MRNNQLPNIYKDVFSIFVFVFSDRLQQPNGQKRCWHCMFLETDMLKPCFNYSVLCCHAVVKIWLGLGIQCTWLGVKKKKESLCFGLKYLFLSAHGWKMSPYFGKIIQFTAGKMTRHLVKKFLIVLKSLIWQQSCFLASVCL